MYFKYRKEIYKYVELDKKYSNHKKQVWVWLESLESKRDLARQGKLKRFCVPFALCEYKPNYKIN
jgi:hypothetical protein|tara:strand:- start:1423 stop:1617 length:195 start_codon:yes stop_codon:yes gene_type:complete